MKLPILILLYLVASVLTVTADDKINVYEHINLKNVAIEQRVNGKFDKCVGKLEFNQAFGDSITLILFTESYIGAITFSDTYKIITAKFLNKNLIYIEGESLYGGKIIGTIDISNEIYSIISLMKDGGWLVTNITKDGKKFCEKYIPNVILGSYVEPTK